MRKLTLPVLASAALLAACVLGPHYRPPETPAAAAGPFVSSAPGVVTGQAPPAQWWRLYDDPALDGMVQEALLRNQDLKVAAANLAYAQAFVGEARAGLLPSTDLTASVAYGKRAAIPPSVTRQPATWSYVPGFTMSYEVDLLGRVRRTIEAANRTAEASQAAEDLVRVTVAAGTAQYYATACSQGEALALALQQLEVSQQTYDITLVQWKAGALSDFDLARAATALEQSRAAVPVFEGLRRTALFELTAFMGRIPSQIPPQAEACRVAPRIAQAIPVGDGAALLRRRPDLRQAERQLAAATAQIGVAMAALYPQVTLGGTISNTAVHTLSNLTAPSGVAFSLGPLISWTFPNISLARARVRENQALASGSLATFDSLVLQALKEAEQALAMYNSELAHHAALDAAARQAGEAFRLAKVQYAAGSASLLDLLTSQAILIQAQQAVAASDLALSTDGVTVFRSLGGGWEDAPPISPPPPPR